MVTGSATAGPPPYWRHPLILAKVQKNIRLMKSTATRMWLAWLLQSTSRLVYHTLLSTVQALSLTLVLSAPDGQWRGWAHSGQYASFVALLGNGLWRRRALGTHSKRVRRWAGTSRGMGGQVAKTGFLYELLRRMLSLDVRPGKDETKSLLRVVFCWCTSFDPGRYAGYVTACG